jgi:V/A-type H+-transporting ATPase subunit I
MIVRMKKITVMVTEKDANSAVGYLRKLGLMHVEPMQPPHADYIDTLNRRISMADKILLLLGDDKRPQQDLDNAKAVMIAKEILALSGHKQELASKIEDLNKRLEWFKEWGDVSYGALQRLKKEGIFIKLYCGPKSILKQIDAEKMVYVLSRQKSHLRLALVTRDEKESLDLAEVQVPNTDNNVLQKMIYILEADLKEIDKRIDDFRIYTKYFSRVKTEFQKRLDFCKVRFGMVNKQGIYCLKGFCPREGVKAVADAAQQQGWALLAEEPDKPGEVPTLIRNPRWIRIIDPVFKFMGTVPGYKEFDISFWFLIFFSLFFAMLIGDAGYGIIFLTTTLYARKRFPKAPSEPFFLIGVLSVATIIWGAITGTWFGCEKIAQLPVFKAIVVSKISSASATNQNFMMGLCFVIGVIHLTIAHAKLALSLINSLKALAQLGWICILWGVFFVANSLVLGSHLNGASLWLLSAGLILAILFSNPQKNMLKGALISLGNLPLSVISSFSDIVSYLRLFAVGYASAIVASSFNDMALASGINSVVAGFSAALILVLGHTLNITLGFMAVIVHGMRLNMLEFSGHLGMEWSGKEYKPFKE